MQLHTGHLKRSLNPLFHIGGQFNRGRNVRRSLDSDPLLRFSDPSLDTLHNVEGVGTHK